MKKYIVLSILALTLVAGTAYAKPNTTDPFKAVWDAIANLQQQIDGIQLLPGPKGDPGEPATHGAGNIAFMFNGDPAYLLKTDGTVWLARSIGTWSNPDYSTGFYQIQGGGDAKVADLPVPVTDIVAWEYYSLVDISGNYWYFNRNDDVWYNYGPLP